MFTTSPCLPVGKMFDILLYYILLCISKENYRKRQKCKKRGRKSISVLFLQMYGKFYFTLPR